MRRLTHCIILAAFIFSCGGHWAVLQGMAWMNMIREYSEMVPLAEAVSMTFSGKYPCEICKAIAEKKSAEQQKALALEKYDKKFLPAAVAPLFRITFSTISFPDFLVVWKSRSDSPLLPPPRTVLI